MAILIVDDESNTRTALRDMLSQLGHKVILEAKNGEEGLKILDSEKNKIRMIIADWEMPYMDGLTFVDRIGTRPHLDLIPFLLITSDLPKQRLLELKTEHPRMDHSLLKPFRMNTLSEGMNQAFSERASKRDTALFLGGKPTLELIATFEKSKGPILKLTTDPDSSGLGAVLIDPHSPPDLVWIQTFKKSVHGSSLPWICLSREPTKVHPLRTVCQIFSEPTSALVSQIQERILGAWKLELLVAEAKALAQDKKYTDALKILKKALDIDTQNSEVHAFMGDLLEGQGESKAALENFQKSAALNPCLPRVYIKSLGIAADLYPSHVLKLSDNAIQYCPQSQEVLFAAASALAKTGMKDRARTTLDQILQMNSKHEAAASLLQSLA